MNWMVWLIGAVFGTALERCLNRSFLRNSTGYWEYLIGYNIGALLFILPFNSTSASFSFDSSVLSLLLISGLFWFLSCLFGFIADSTTEVSVTGVLSQLQMVFILVGGILFLGETFTLMKVFGTFLVVLGLTLLVPKIQMSLSKGVLFKIAGTLFGAAALLLDKNLLNYFDSSAISITGYAIPLFLAIGLRPKVLLNALKESKRIHYLNIVMGILGCATYNMLLQSFKSAPISIAFPIYQLNLVLTLLAGYFILNEKELLWRKVACTVLVILGSWVIQ